MIRKQINWEGFDKALLIRLNEDGSILCDLEKWDILEDGSEQFVCKESNISFDEGNYPFSLTDEEILILRPKIAELNE